MIFDTGKEELAYDKGWADAKDWWMPLEQDRILKLMEENFKRFDASNNLIDFMSFEDFKKLVEETKWK
jgi:hypothetical protein